MRHDRCAGTTNSRAWWWSPAVVDGLARLNPDYPAVSNEPMAEIAKAQRLLDRTEVKS